MFNPLADASLWEKSKEFLNLLNPFSQPVKKYNLPQYQKALNTTIDNDPKFIFNY